MSLNDNKKQLAFERREKLSEQSQCEVLKQGIFPREG